MIFDRFRKRSDKSADKSADRPADQAKPRTAGPGGMSSGAASESREFLTGDSDIDRRSLQLLLDTMAEVGTTLELDRLLVDLVDKSIETTRSERGFLLLVEEGKAPEDVEVRVARAAGGKAIPLDTSYSTSVAGKVLSTGTPIANVVQSSQQALDLGQSVYDLKLRAVMCVPLEARGQRFGAIYVDSRAERHEFSQRDLAFFAALSQQMAVSLDNARLYTESIERARLSQELELANKIQQQLLPETTGLPDDLDAATWYRAAEAASGDSYDLVVDADGAVSVMLGDVSGHGIGSALIAHSAQSALTSYLEVLHDPAEVLRRLDKRFARGVEAGSFMSMFVARLACGADGKRSLSFVNAGHGCSWHLTKDGVETLGTNGPALGMVEGFEYDAPPARSFEPGDLLFLCSDGVTEARNAARDMLGEARLIEVLSGAHGKSAEALLEDVRALLRSWTDSFDDDVMLLAIAAR